MVFVFASSLFINPLGLYLALVPSDPKNQVDIWIYTQNHQSQHLVQVVLEVLQGALQMN